MELPLQYLMDGDYKICVSCVVHYKCYDNDSRENMMMFSFF